MGKELYNGPKQATELNRLSGVGWLQPAATRWNLGELEAMNRLQEFIREYEKKSDQRFFRYVGESPWDGPLVYMPPVVPKIPWDFNAATEVEDVQACRITWQDPQTFAVHVHEYRLAFRKEPL